jgi:hypothetical protein
MKLEKSASETNKEIKKTIVTEPIKLGIQGIGTLLAPTILVALTSAIPYVRESVWPFIPKIGLLALVVVLITSNVIFWLLWRKGRQELSERPEMISFIPPEIIDQGEPYFPPSIADQISCVSISRTPIIFRNREIHLRTNTKTMTAQDFRAFTAKFQLKPVESLKSITVRAVVSINSDAQDLNYFIHDGVWMNSSTNFIRIPPGGFGEVVLGVRKNDEFLACEPEYIKEPYNFRPVLGDKAQIVVELISIQGDSVEFTKTFTFDVTLGPNFSIVEEGVKPSSGTLPAGTIPETGWRQARDLGSQIELMEAALFGSTDFSFLQHDARFDRLKEKIRAENFDSYVSLLIRLLNRAEMALSNREDNSDVAAVKKALSAETFEVASRILNRSGLI